MRAAAVSTGPDTHLDHLGVLASLLEIPLIVTERRSYELAKEFYPHAKTEFIEHSDLSLDFLATNYDVLFGCGKYWCLELQPLFQLLFGKRMRHILCPHGNSDKGSTLSAGSHPPQDLALVYGNHMRDLLTRTGALAEIGGTITTGNYRYPFYRRYRSFYDELALRRVFSNFSKDKKTILYAPTWSSREEPTAFFETCREIIEQLAPDYNLLIKPHPFLEEQQPAHLAHLQTTYEGAKNLAFVTSFPAIYPLLARADLYLGDFSSIGYDFLAFDRPLYFFNLKESAAAKPTLYQCGVEIPKAESRNLRKFLENASEGSSNKRREIYDYAFGEEREIREIKKEIETALLES
ncbi:MAG: CDP-glycerol glycerophosphotransferase family protein [Chlamydiales bacterium]|nr:CDP-glycerol glycerophosphotransferase family protein [Chlamydiales bacterium]